MNAEFDAGDTETTFYNRKPWPRDALCLLVRLIDERYAARSDACDLDDDLAILRPCKVGRLPRFGEESAGRKRCELAFIPRVPEPEIQRAG